MNLKLADISIGIPLIEMETEISYTTLRKPTAFERVLLNMIQKFSIESMSDKQSLEDIFSQILCVPDPSPLVVPTLYELRDINVINITKNIDLINQISLQDIQLTKRGKDIISQGQLPTKPKVRPQIFYYDPIQETLLSESSARLYKSSPPELCIDHSIFDDTFPIQLIQSEIIDGDHAWFVSSSHIEQIKKKSFKYSWKSIPISIETHSNYLIINSNSDIINDYFKKIETNESYDRFISKTFHHRGFIVDDLMDFNKEINDDKSAEIGSILFFLQRKWPEDARFIVLGKNYDMDLIPTQVPKHQAIIIYNEIPSEDNIFIEWNDDKSGCKIFINQEHPMKNTLLLSNVENIICYKIGITYGKKNYDIAIACREKTNIDDNNINLLLENITRIFSHSTNFENTSIPVFWQGESNFVNNTVKELQNWEFSIIEVIAKYQEILENAKKILPKIDNNLWYKGLYDLLLHLFLEVENIEIYDIEKILQSLPKDNSILSGEKNHLLRTISNIVQPPKNIEELQKLASCFRLLNQEWTPAYPSKYFNDNLLESILSDFPSSANLNLIFDDNDLFNSLRTLFMAAEKIKKFIGINAFDSLESHDDYLSIIKEFADGSLLPVIVEWESAFNSMSSALNDKSLMHQTEVDHYDKKIRKLSSYLNKLIKSTDPNIQNIYVLDTSALIKRPDILSTISQGELVVVAKKVIDELDDKKLDEKLRTQISKVINKLQKLTSESIDYSEGDMSLLPSDYRIKGDNLILSVAVRYRQSNPILVTDDKNLSLKARAEGLKSMSADEFMARKRIISPANRKKRRKKRRRK